MTESHDLEALIGYHLRRASNVIMADLAERLATLGLKATEASILVVLDQEPHVTQSEIGRRLGIKRANMAPLVAGLVARDLVGRGKTIGRMHPLALAPKGKALIADVRARMAEHDTDVFGAFSAEDRHVVRSMLAAIWQKGS